MKKIFLATTFFTVVVSTTFAQKQQPQQLKAYNYSHGPKVSMGVGFGLDYGGIGMKAELLPTGGGLGIFAGIGYNLAKLGYNIGVSIRPFVNAKLQPFVMAMYGYNGVIHYEYDNATYVNYGLSGGIGGELKVNKRQDRLYAAILYPFRDGVYPMPVTFSLGFNFLL